MACGEGGNCNGGGATEGQLRAVVQFVEEGGGIFLRADRPYCKQAFV